MTWLVNSIPAALGVAVLSMTAKALGSGDREYLQKIAKQILIFSFLRVDFLPAEFLSS